MDASVFFVILASLGTVFFFSLYIQKSNELSRIKELSQKVVDDFSKIEKELKQNGDIEEKRAKFESDKEEHLKSFELKKEELKEERKKLKAEIEKETRELKSRESRLENISTENLALREVIEQLANLWINDSFKSVCAQVKYNNFAQQESRMSKIFEKCRSFGIIFDGRQEQGFYTRLRNIWQKECDEQRAKEEQERIKEIMREEQRAEKLRVAELKKIEDQEKQIILKQKENDEKLRHLREIEALKSLNDAQRAELQEVLKDNELLAEELASKERAKSMAELTRAGHIYVISNIGSFGEGVFKIGMTRRLIPEDRIDELGDASVPFPFDIHMMISTEDAPSLEKQIHDSLEKCRVNFVNERKEFFMSDLESIRKIVDEHSPGSKYHFVDIPEATQWRESLLIRKKLNENITKEAA